MKKICTLLLLSVCWTQAIAQICITTPGGAGATTITWDAATAGIVNGPFVSGISATPAAGELDMNGIYIRDDISGTAEDASVGFGSGATTNFNFPLSTTSTGGVVTSGVYAFDVGGGNIVLGVQGSGSRWGDAPGDDGHLVFRIQNKMGSPLTCLDISYILWALNDQGRGTIVEAYVTDDIATPSFGPILATASSTVSADAAPAWSPISLPSFSVTGLNVPNNGYVYLRFLIYDLLGSGSRDEIGIDALTIKGKTTSPTPVQLSKFLAQTDGNKVNLEWTTETELNAKSFEVERSFDGIHFSTIASMDAYGNSELPLDYTAVDQKPFVGTNYYRLKMIDLDGKYMFGKIVEANIANGALWNTSLFPNPASDMIQVRISSLVNDRLNIALYDVKGRALKNYTLSINEGQNIYQVFLDDVTPGQYFLKFEGRHIKEVLQIQKL